MFLLPSRLRELLENSTGGARTFYADQELLATFQETAQAQGRPKEEVRVKFVSAGHDQYLQTSELEERWDIP